MNYEVLQQSMDFPDCTYTLIYSPTNEFLMHMSNMGKYVIKSHLKTQLVHQVGLWWFLFIGLSLVSYLGQVDKLSVTPGIVTRGETRKLTAPQCTLG